MAGGGVRVGAEGMASVSAARPHAIVLLTRRQTWRHAVSTVAVVLRNSLFSAAAAYVTTWSCSRGNVLSRRTIATQSYGEFLLATLLSGHFCYSVLATFTQSTLLLRLRLVRSPAAAITLLGAVRHVARRSIGFYLASLAVLIGATAACNASSLPSHVRQYKLEAYVGWLCCFAYTIGVGLAGRFVYKNETIEGRESSAISTISSIKAGAVHVRRVVASPEKKKSKKKRTKNLTIGDASAWPAPRAFAVRLPPGGGTTVRALTRSPTLWQRSTRFWYAWWHVVEARAPILLLGCGTLAYVQVLSTRSITRSVEGVALIVGNVLLKLLIQRVARRYLLPRDIKSIRTMVIAVGPPIALVDTQLRVILQRANSTQLTVVGTALMALLEICVRAAKAVATRRQLRQWEAEHAATRTSSSSTEQRHRERAVPGETLQATAKLLAFRSAELYADMVAEYIAMGCATSILLVYWSHPKYRLAEGSMWTSGDASRTGSAAQWSQHQTALLVAQVLVEVVVDTLSCSLEISYGVTFDGVREQRVYLAFVFVATAVGNVLISAVVFLRVDDAAAS
ncbi:hypothetical protein P43SY_003326 [Pythium insidiosum]|uniref:Transmembrane protein n=1 Tax=Pythium insidiosum TaxID=114742 RepID=A0AAD5LZ26_PYTIN|nr:hypothetical protein P43SY_003326 [Pythium insidiosum]